MTARSDGPHAPEVIAWMEAHGWTYRGEVEPGNFPLFVKEYGPREPGTVSVDAGNGSDSV